LRYVTIGRYQFSVVLLLVAVAASPIAFAATYYLCARKTISVSVDEPLSITNFPSSIHFHPGENETLAITILNVATINYSVILTFTLNDTNYQQSYLQLSNYTYNIVPGTNNVTAWILVASDAPGGWHELTVDFYRQ